MGATAVSCACANANAHMPRPQTACKQQHKARACAADWPRSACCPAPPPSWRVNKGLARDLLPPSPKDVRLEGWWVVNVVNVGEAACTASQQRAVCAAACFYCRDLQALLRVQRMAALRVPHHRITDVAIKRSTHSTPQHAITLGPCRIAALPPPSLLLLLAGDGEFRELSPAEAGLLRAACESPCPLVCCYEPGLLQQLYRRGVIYFDIPVAPDDRFTLPPLEVCQ